MVEIPPEAWHLINGRLDRIQEDVEDIKRYMRDHPTCPQPGLCVTLNDDIARLLEMQEKQSGRLVALERKVAWFTGIGITLLTVITFFGDNIRHLFVH
jgi:hypothetical protein